MHMKDCADPGVGLIARHVQRRFGGQTGWQWRTNIDQRQIVRRERTFIGARARHHDMVRIDSRRKIAAGGGHPPASSGKAPGGDHLLLRRSHGRGARVQPCRGVHAATASVSTRARAEASTLSISQNALFAAIKRAPGLMRGFRRRHAGCARQSPQNPDCAQSRECDG